MASGRVDGFLPSTSGFRFPNSFPKGVAVMRIPLPGLGVSVPLGDASNGVCGGMVYAATDLFLASPRLRPPTDTTPPPDGSAMTTYITKRLIDSFALERGPASNVARYLALMSTPDSDSWLVRGVPWVIANREFPKIKADIDAGRPSPIGLVAGEAMWPTEISKKLKNLGHCHQVVAYAYAYDDGLLTLNVYDSNDPGHDDSTIVVDLSNPSRKTTISTQRITSNISGHHIFRAFFRHDYYTRATPPPGVSAGAL